MVVPRNDLIIFRIPVYLKPCNGRTCSRVTGEDTQVERAMAVTGCKDAKTVRLMTRIVKSMAVYCRENLITDGCCGMRELISWVQSYMVCGDIREAARYTVLASASADAENRTEVEESCLDTVLAA